MKLSRKLAVAVIPLVAVLAGCKTTQNSAQSAPAQTQTTAQVASVEIYAASDKAVKGYNPVQISKTQTIYVSAKPIITRDHLIDIEPIPTDAQGRSFVRLGLNEAGQKAMTKIPKGQGYVTAVGGQVVSLAGVVKGANFLFLSRDEKASLAIVAAVTGQPVQAKK